MRSFRDGDEISWLQILNKSLKDCSDYATKALQDIQRPRSAPTFQPENVIFAFLNNQPVGLIHMSQHQTYLDINELAVLPQHQRKGIGTRLLDEAITTLKRSKTTLIHVRSRTVKAYINFYKKHGFQAVRKYYMITWNLTKPLPKLDVNQNVTIQPVTLDTIEDLASLASKAYAPYWNWWYERCGGSEAVRQLFRETAHKALETRQPRTWLIAYLTRTPVGFAAAQMDPTLTQKEGTPIGTMWNGVAVLPKYRRQLIGSRLLTKILKLQKQKGVTKTMVGTFSYLHRYTPAVKLYLKSGGTITNEMLGLEKQFAQTNQI